MSVPVDSSAIREIGYAADRRELFITFVGGRRYVYFDVPQAVYRALAHAESLGRYFNLRIRDRYDFRKLR